MTSKIFAFAVVFYFQLFAVAGPLVVGNAAGPEENHYVSLWSNRGDLFQQCLQANIDCQMSETEKAVLQKIGAAAKLWKPFQFHSDSDFLARSEGLAQPANLPFVAYSKQPGIVMFNFSLLYTDSNKFSFDKKLALLATIAADQAGLTVAEAKPVIVKLTAFWQKRWSKLDLRILAEPSLQVWIQQGASLAMLVFDDVGTFDLVPVLASKVRCDEGKPAAFKVSSVHWSSHHKTLNAVQAALSGSFSYQCGGSEVTVLNFEIELSFQKLGSEWKFDADLLKVHLSSLE